MNTEIGVELTADQVEYLVGVLLPAMICICCLCVLWTVERAGMIRDVWSAVRPAKAEKREKEQVEVEEIEFKGELHDMGLL